jgi:excinuclease ABC subunit C
MNADIKKKLAKLPKKPGVYFHKDKTGGIIYVGKAAKLNNRVKQYFQVSRYRNPKTDLLISEIADIDWIEVDSEADALFLEAEMIKRYMPKYNILLRDDKSYCYIRIDKKSIAPSVIITRRPFDDGAEYFGPFMQAGSLRKALKYLRKAFPYSTHISLPSRACLQFHLGLCPGPETASYNRAGYIKDLNNLILYIKGEKSKVIKNLELEMAAASKSQNYEKAAILRNRVRSLKILQAQIIFGDKESIDLSKDHALADLTMLLNLKNSPRKIYGFDISHLQGSDTVASKVVFSNGAADKKNYRKFKMRIKGNDDYLHMHEVLARSLRADFKTKQSLPNLILIDGGKGQLSAAAKALKEQNIKLPMIGIAKRQEEIIMSRVLSNIELNLSYLTKLKGLKSEETQEFAAVLLPPNSHIIKLLQRIRDESHRFALSYHSSLKTKRQSSSMLDEIMGIGPMTKKKLLIKFGSLKGIKQADIKQVSAIVGSKKAKLVKLYLDQNTPGQTAIIDESQ